MNIERLYRVATMLRNLPPDQPFSLYSWGDANYDDNGDPCGTVACACGYAALDPWFQAQGLVLLDASDDPIPDVAAFNKADLSYDATIMYDGRTNWCAVTRFFDLSADDAHYLFNYPSYPAATRTTAIEVANRIEDYIARNSQTENA